MQMCRNAGSTCQRRRSARCFSALGTPSRMNRSEEHTSELQSLMRISYAVFCLKKKTKLLREQYQTSTSKRAAKRDRSGMKRVTHHDAKKNIMSHSHPDI